MSTKYTPGPWRLDKRGNTYIVDKHGDGYITRDVCRMDSSTMAAFHQEGNALLIAPAPDLLAACWNVVLAADDTERVIAVEQARAAIAKATSHNKV